MLNAAPLSRREGQYLKMLHLHSFSQNSLGLLFYIYTSYLNKIIEIIEV